MMLAILAVTLLSAAVDDFTYTSALTPAGSTAYTAQGSSCRVSWDWKGDEIRVADSCKLTHDDALAVHGRLLAAVMADKRKLKEVRWDDETRGQDTSDPLLVGWCSEFNSHAQVYEQQRKTIMKHSCQWGPDAFFMHVFKTENLGTDLRDLFATHHLPLTLHTVYKSHPCPVAYVFSVEAKPAPPCTHR